MTLSSNAPILLDLQLDRFYDALAIKHDRGKDYIKDPIRKKWFILTPEEMVRQLLILHLLEIFEPTKRMISVEKQIDVHGLKKRFDLLIYDQKGKPKLLVECKAPGIELNDEVFIQISNYNFALSVPFLLISNGRASYLCHIDQENKSYNFLEHLNLNILSNEESS